MRLVTLALALAATIPSGSPGAQDSTKVPVSRAETDSQISAVRREADGPRLPSADSITFGGREIAAGITVSGVVAVAAGDLRVNGTIDGDAISVGGDVIVLPGGRITGNALAAFGQVRLEGGTVDGEMRSLRGAVGVVPEAGAAKAVSPAVATRQAVKLSVGWLVVLALIGIGVLVFAAPYLDGVVDQLEEGFWRSLLTGVAGQLAIAPALALIVIGLAITIVGALLIPFAIVAFVLALAGLLTLGFLAVARMTGESLAGRGTRALSARGSALRALLVGLMIYMGLWVLAAAFTWQPIAGAVLRGVALALSYVALTAGFGAAVLSRGGTRRDEPQRVVAKAPDPALWQTPTPVTGVVAARRPVSAPPRERV